MTQITGTGQKRGYDKSQTDEERLTELANLDPQNRGSLPAYPHADEPAETVPEHAIERTMGHEVRPARREPRSAPPRQAGPMPIIIRQERPLPAHMMSCHVPDLTGAGRMMNRPLPNGMTGTPKGMFGTAPKTGEYMKFDIPKASAPKGSRLDPFRGLDGSSFKKKKLPAGMQMFGTKKKKSPKMRFIR